LIPLGLALACGLLLRKFEGAGAAQDAGAFVPGTCALCFVEVGLDIVAVRVALHGKDSMRVVLCDVAFSFQLSAAVVGNLAIDDELAGPPSSPCWPWKTPSLIMLGNSNL
jgi:hypothetical protein